MICKECIKVFGEHWKPGPWVHCHHAELCECTQTEGGYWSCRYISGGAFVYNVRATYCPECGRKL